MIIRYAELSDIDELLGLYKRFHAEVQESYGIPFDEDTLMERIAGIIQNHVGWVMEEEGKLVGVMGGIVTSMLFDKNTKVFMEVSWYVTPEFRRHGMKMLETAQKYCMDLKVQRMIIGHMGNADRDRFEKVYARKGFELFEQHYIKELKYEDR